MLCGVSRAEKQGPRRLFADRFADMFAVEG